MAAPSSRPSRTYRSRCPITRYTLDFWPMNDAEKLELYGVVIVATMTNSFLVREQDQSVTKAFRLPPTLVILASSNIRPTTPRL
jgi:hypothetical protein